MTSAGIWLTGVVREFQWNNPHAWIRKTVGADEVATLSADNRPITHPYPIHGVAFATTGIPAVAFTGANNTASIGVALFIPQTTAVTATATG